MSQNKDSNSIREIDKLENIEQHSKDMIFDSFFLIFVYENKT